MSSTDIILSTIPRDGDLLSAQEAYDFFATLVCEECLARAKGYLAGLHDDERFCPPCGLAVLARHKDQKKAAFIKARSGLNPIRAGKTTGWNKEDILFSGQKSGIRGQFKVGFETLPDGKVEVVVPMGAPPDSMGYNKNRALQREKKTMAAKRVRDALDRKNETKSESKTKAPETHEEMMVRYKAMCDLLGEDEASKMMDSDFWMD
jgi:hypothetical protein